VPGGLQALLGPPQFGTEPPPVPPGYQQVPNTPPGHSVFLPPELAQDPNFVQGLLQQLATQVPAWRPDDGSRAFFNGAQPNVNDLRGAESFPTSPGRDWYEVVGSQDEADQVLAEGMSPPLIWRWPMAPSFTDLAEQQKNQYASPGGTPLFAADAQGRLFRGDDADRRSWDAGGLAGLGRRGGR
jgi:hypothetical protein